MLGITARVLLLVSAGLLLLSYSAIFVNPAKAWYVSLFGLLFIPFALLNLILLIWAAYRRSGVFLIPLVALLPAIFLIGRYVQIGSGSSRQREGSYKILTYNVGKFTLGKNNAFSLDSVARFIMESDADVVCLQEFNVKTKEVPEIMKDYFPGYDACYYVNVNSNESTGNITLTKLPIEGRGHFDFPESANLAIYSDIRFGDRIMRVYNCHFQSYSISLASLARSWRHKSAVREAEYKYKNSIIKRPRQVEQVMDDIEECQVESIVAGDFNDTPMSYTYHRLQKGRKDTFVDGGSGFGATYSVFWPLIRIDYVLIPQSCSTSSCTIPHLPYSDHYPVITTINLPD